MCIDPEDAEISSVARIEIGDWSEIDEAIAAQSDNTIRTMYLNRFSSCAGLSNESASTKNAILKFQSLSRLWLRHGDCFHGTIWGRSQPDKQSRSEIVIVHISALPLRHMQP
jgi:hypothetical protein